MSKRLVAIGIVLVLLALVLAGIAVWQHRAPAALAYRMENLPLTIEMPPSHYPITALQRYTVTIATHDDYPLHVARYRDAAQHDAAAIVFLAEGGQAEAKRLAAWRHAAEAIVQHTAPNDLFLAWWDNSQRIELFTGRPVWFKQPPAANWPEAERALWRVVAGGFAEDDSAARQMARWLSLPAHEALQDIARTFSTTSVRAVYLLVTADDLARWPEVSRWTTQPLSFESMLFQSNHDWHGLIKQVRYWAQSGTQSSYMLQPLEGLAVRAWRATDTVSAASLWGQTLPFINPSAPENDAETPLTLVYRSPWSRYIAIYRLWTEQ